MFGADLTENYLGVAEAFDLSVTEVTHLARNSFEATFADSGRTATMLAQFDDDVRALRSELGV
jgi:adenosine deaminase